MYSHTSYLSGVICGVWQLNEYNQIRVHYTDRLTSLEKNVCVIIHAGDIHGPNPVCMYQHAVCHLRFYSWRFDRSMRVNGLMWYPLDMGGTG